MFTRDVHLCLTVGGIVALTLQKRENTCMDETDRDPVADNVNDMALMGGIDSLEKELINHINW